MRQVIRVVPVIAAILAVSVCGFAGQIYGDYVEARNAEVYVGPCVANGEMGLAGDLATLAWVIRKGEWNGVNLDGLGVVALAKAKATLGDPYANVYPAKSMIVVDQRATENQKKALVAFAQSMTGRLLENVTSVQSAPISMEVGEEHGSVFLKAGDIASIQTRALTDLDHLCGLGNEDIFYPPLTELSHSMPAFTIANRFEGNALGSVCRTFGKRSAFVGTFER